MNQARLSLKSGIAAILLACFAFAMIPADLLHNHGYLTSKDCADSNSQYCSHKLHVTKKADFCWACAVHFDKPLPTGSFAERILKIPGVEVFSHNEVFVTITRWLVLSLRGPPAH